MTTRLCEKIKDSQQRWPRQGGREAVEKQGSKTGLDRRMRPGTLRRDMVGNYWLLSAKLTNLTSA